MKSVWVVCFVIGLGFLWVGFAGAEQEKRESESPMSSSQHDCEFEKTVTRTLSCKYLLYLPKGYGEKEQKWPLILFLHGAGERGNDLNKVKLHGPPKLVEAGKSLPFIVVSPQCPRERWWSNEVLINLLDDIESRYEVDTERVYLTGLSMGGFGTWKLACEYPKRFAAIAPICGGGEPFMAGFLKNVPVWAFHGAKDPLVPLKRTEEMVEAVEKFGGEAKLTVYPEAGHDSWTQAYENRQLYDWFLSHRRVLDKE